MLGVMVGMATLAMLSMADDSKTYSLRVYPPQPSSPTFLPTRNTSWMQVDESAAEMNPLHTLDPYGVDENRAWLPLSIAGLKVGELPGDVNVEVGGKPCVGGVEVIEDAKTEFALVVCKCVEILPLRTFVEIVVSWERFYVTGGMWTEDVRARPFRFHSTIQLEQSPTSITWLGRSGLHWLGEESRLLVGLGSEGFGIARWNASLRNGRVPSWELKDEDTIEAFSGGGGSAGGSVWIGEVLGGEGMRKRDDVVVQQKNAAGEWELGMVSVFGDKEVDRIVRSLEVLKEGSDEVMRLFSRRGGLCLLGDVSSIGEIHDVAVGVPELGAVYLVSITLDGFASMREVDSPIYAPPPLAPGSSSGFGTSLAFASEWGSSYGRASPSYCDLLAGAPNAFGNKGAVVLLRILCTKQSSSSNNPITLQAHQIIPGDVVSASRVGSHVTLIGDVDGDGYVREFITTAPGIDTTISSTISTLYLVLLSTSLEDVERSIPIRAGLPSTPWMSAATSITCIGSVGDIDGDGFPDLGVGFDGEGGGDGGGGVHILAGNDIIATSRTEHVYTAISSVLPEHGNITVANPISKSMTGAVTVQPFGSLDELNFAFDVNMVTMTKVVSVESFSINGENCGSFSMIPIRPNNTTRDPRRFLVRCIAPPVRGLTFSRVDINVYATVKFKNDEEDAFSSGSLLRRQDNAENSLLLPKTNDTNLFKVEVGRGAKVVRWIGFLEHPIPSTLLQAFAIGYPDENKVSLLSNLTSTASTMTLSHPNSTAQYGSCISFLGNLDASGDPRALIVGAPGIQRVFVEKYDADGRREPMREVKSRWDLVGFGASCATLPRYLGLIGVGAPGSNAVVFMRLGRGDEVVVQDELLVNASSYADLFQIVSPTESGFGSSVASFGDNIMYAFVGAPGERCVFGIRLDLHEQLIPTRVHRVDPSTLNGLPQLSPSLMMQWGKDGVDEVDVMTSSNGGAIVVRLGTKVLVIDLRCGLQCNAFGVRIETIPSTVVGVQFASDVDGDGISDLVYLSEGGASTRFVEGVRRAFLDNSRHAFRSFGRGSLVIPRESISYDPKSTSPSLTPNPLLSHPLSAVAIKHRASFPRPRNVEDSAIVFLDFGRGRMFDEDLLGTTISNMPMESCKVIDRRPFLTGLPPLAILHAVAVLCTGKVTQIVQLGVSNSLSLSLTVPRTVESNILSNAFVRIRTGWGYSFPFPDVHLQPLSASETLQTSSISSMVMGPRGGSRKIRVANRTGVYLAHIPPGTALSPPAAASLASASLELWHEAPQNVSDSWGTGMTCFDASHCFLSDPILSTIHVTTIRGDQMLKVMSPVLESMPRNASVGASILVGSRSRNDFRPVLAVGIPGYGDEGKGTVAYGRLVEMKDGSPFVAIVDGAFWTSSAKRGFVPKLIPQLYDTFANIPTLDVGARFGASLAYGGSFETLLVGAPGDMGGRGSIYSIYALFVSTWGGASLSRAPQRLSPGLSKGLDLGDVVQESGFGVGMVNIGDLERGRSDLVLAVAACGGEDIACGVYALQYQYIGDGIHVNYIFRVTSAAPSPPLLFDPTSSPTSPALLHLGDWEGDGRFLSLLVSDRSLNHPTRYRMAVSGWTPQIPGAFGTAIEVDSHVNLGDDADMLSWLLSQPRHPQFDFQRLPLPLQGNRNKSWLLPVAMGIANLSSLTTLYVNDPFLICYHSRRLDTSSITLPAPQENRHVLLCEGLPAAPPLKSVALFVPWGEFTYAHSLQGLEVQPELVPPLFEDPNTFDASQVFPLPSLSGYPAKSFAWAGDVNMDGIGTDIVLGIPDVDGIAFVARDHSSSPPSFFGPSIGWIGRNTSSSILRNSSFGESVAWVSTHLDNNQAADGFVVVGAPGAVNGDAEENFAKEGAVWLIGVRWMDDGVEAVWEKRVNSRDIDVSLGLDGSEFGAAVSAAPSSYSSATLVAIGAPGINVVAFLWFDGVVVVSSTYSSASRIPSLAVFDGDSSFGASVSFTKYGNRVHCLIGAPQAKTIGVLTEDTSGSIASPGSGYNISFAMSGISPFYSVGFGALGYQVAASLSSGDLYFLTIAQTLGYNDKAHFAPQDYFPNPPPGCLPFSSITFLPDFDGSFQSALLGLCASGMDIVFLRTRSFESATHRSGKIYPGLPMKSMEVTPIPPILGGLHPLPPPTPILLDAQGRDGRRYLPIVVKTDFAYAFQRDGVKVAATISGAPCRETIVDRTQACEESPSFCGPMWGRVWCVDPPLLGGGLGTFSLQLNVRFPSEFPAIGLRRFYVDSQAPPIHYKTLFTTYIKPNPPTFHSLPLSSPTKFNATNGDVAWAPSLGIGVMLVGNPGAGGGDGEVSVVKVKKSGEMVGVGGGIVGRDGLGFGASVSWLGDGDGDGVEEEALSGWTGGEYGGWVVWKVGSGEMWVSTLPGGTVEAGSNCGVAITSLERGFLLEDDVGASTFAMGCPGHGEGRGSTVVVVLDASFRLLMSKVFVDSWATIGALMGSSLALLRKENFVSSPTRYLIAGAPAFNHASAPVQHSGGVIILHLQGTLLTGVLYSKVGDISSGHLPTGTLTEYARFGESVVSLGDLDGDGCDWEIAVSAPAHSEGPRVFIVWAESNHAYQINTITTISSSSSFPIPTAFLASSTAAAPPLMLPSVNLGFTGVDRGEERYDWVWVHPNRSGLLLWDTASVSTRPQGTHWRQPFAISPESSRITAAFPTSPHIVRLSPNTTTYFPFTTHFRNITAMFPIDELSIGNIPCSDVKWSEEGGSVHSMPTWQCSTLPPLPHDRSMRVRGAFVVDEGGSIEEVSVSNIAKTPLPTATLFTPPFLELQAGVGELESWDLGGSELGAAIAPLGSVLDGSRVRGIDGDIAVGAPGYDAGRGRVLMLSLDAGGKEVVGVSVLSNPSITLSQGDEFGAALVSIRNNHSSNSVTLCVGAPGTNSGTGVVWVVGIGEGGVVGDVDKVTAREVYLGGRFGASLAWIRQIHADGVLFVGSPAVPQASPGTGIVEMLSWNKTSNSFTPSNIGDGYIDRYEGCATKPTLFGRALAALPPFAFQHDSGVIANLGVTTERGDVLFFPLARDVTFLSVFSFCIAKNVFINTSPPSGLGSSLSWAGGWNGEGDDGVVVGGSNGVVFFTLEEGTQPAFPSVTGMEFVPSRAAAGSQIGVLWLGRLSPGNAFAGSGGLWLMGSGNHTLYLREAYDRTQFPLKRHSTTLMFGSDNHCVSLNPFEPPMCAANEGVRMIASEDDSEFWDSVEDMSAFQVLIESDIQDLKSVLEKSKSLGISFVVDDRDGGNGGCGGVVVEGVKGDWYRHRAVVKCVAPYIPRSLSEGVEMNDLIVGTVTVTCSPTEPYHHLLGSVETAIEVIQPPPSSSPLSYTAFGRGFFHVLPANNPPSPSGVIATTLPTLQHSHFTVQLSDVLVRLEESELIVRAEYSENLKAINHLIRTSTTSPLLLNAGLGWVASTEITGTLCTPPGANETIYVSTAAVGHVGGARVVFSTLRHQVHAVDGGERLQVVGGEWVVVRGSGFGFFNLSLPAITPCAAAWETLGFDTALKTTSPPAMTIAAVREEMFWVYVGGRPCLQVIWLSSAAIHCQVPSGTGRNVPVAVVILGVVVTLHDAVSYNPTLPPISTAKVLQGVENDEVVYLPQDGGGLIEIGGETVDLVLDTSTLLTPISYHLGPWDVSLEGAVVGVRNSTGRKYLANVTIGEGIGFGWAPALCANETSYWNSDVRELATFFFPQWSQKQGGGGGEEEEESLPAPFVKICSDDGNAVAKLNFEPPTIISVRPNIDLDAVGGQVLTIRASKLGKSSLLAMSGSSVEVLLGDDVPCTNLVPLNDETVTCTTPALAGTAARVLIGVHGAWSQTVSVSVLRVSAIGVSPSLVMPALKSLGETVDFTLDVLGADRVIGVFIGSKPCPTITLGNGVVTCPRFPVPPRWPNDDVWLLASPNSTTAKRPLLRSLPPPEIFGISAKAGIPTRGGSLLTLLGAGFGISKADVAQIYIGGDEEEGVGFATSRSRVEVAVEDIVSFTSTKITFPMPRGAGSGVGLRVGTRFGLVSEPFFVSFDPPRPQQVTPNVLYPGVSNISVTICGESFAPSPTISLSAFIGGIQCPFTSFLNPQCFRCLSFPTPSSSSTSSSSSSIPSAPAEWLGEGVEVIVEGRGSGVVEGLVELVPLPEISTVTPAVAGPGDLLVLGGEGFGVKREDVLRVWIGADGVVEEAVGLEWRSGEELRVRVPSNHTLWSRPGARVDYIVASVEVRVEMSPPSSLSSLPQTFTPTDLRLRPMFETTPVGIGAWRDTGISNTLIVRWRYPGQSLEASLNPIGAAPATSFDVEVNWGEGSGEEAGGEAFVAVARKTSIEASASEGDVDVNSIDAWERHRVKVPIISRTPVRVRVRATNNDGEGEWEELENGEIGLAYLGAVVPETCLENEYLATERARDGESKDGEGNGVYCEPCPSGAVCAGLPSEQVTALQDYWRVPWAPASLGFARCPIDGACKGHVGQHVEGRLHIQPVGKSGGGENRTLRLEEVWKFEDTRDRAAAVPGASLHPNEIEKCREGHRGVLCAACVPGYFPGVASACTTCGDRAWIAIRFLLLLTVMAIGLSALLMRAWRVRAEKSSKAVQTAKICFSALQTVSIIGSVQLQWPPAAREFFSIVDIGSSFTTSGLALECLLGEQSRSPYARTLVILSMPLWLISLAALLWGGIGWWEKWRANSTQTTTPRATRAFSPTLTPSPSCSCCGWFTRCFSTCSSLDWTLYRSRMVVSTIVIAFLIHTPLTSAAFRLLTCRLVAPSSSSGVESLSHAQLRLAMDLDVSCKGQDLTVMLSIGLPTILLISFGIPIASAAFLTHIGADELARPEWREVLGFLYNGYRSDFVWWESAVLLRKVLLAFVTTALGPSGGAMQVLTGFLVLLLSLLAHSRASPYTSRVINALESFALVTSSLTMVGAVFVILDSVDAVGNSSYGTVGETASIFIALVNVAFFLTAFILLSSRARGTILQFLARMKEEIEVFFGLDDLEGVFTTGPSTPSTPLPKLGDSASKSFSHQNPLFRSRKEPPTSGPSLPGPQYL